MVVLLLSLLAHRNSDVQPPVFVANPRLSGDMCPARGPQFQHASQPRACLGSASDAGRVSHVKSGGWEFFWWLFKGKLKGKPSFWGVPYIRHTQMWSKIVSPKWVVFWREARTSCGVISTT